MMKLALALLVVAAFVAPAAHAAACDAGEGYQWSACDCGSSGSNNCGDAANGYYCKDNTCVQGECTFKSGWVTNDAECHCGTGIGAGNCGGDNVNGQYCDDGTCSTTSSSSWSGDCSSMTSNDWKKFGSALMGGSIAATVIAFIGCGLATAIVCQCGCGPGLNGNATPIAGVALLTGAIGAALPFFLIGPACKSTAKNACGENSSDHYTALVGLCKVGGFLKTYIPPSPGCLGLGAGIGSCVCACLIFCKCCKYGEFVKGGGGGAAAQGTVVVQGAAA